MTSPHRAPKGGTPQRPITASRLVQLDRGLSPRDRAIVAALGVAQVASTQQLARIVIGDADPATALRLARRSLQRLRATGLVRRFADRAWDRRVGAPGYVHALTVAGLKLAGQVHGVGVHHRTSWRPSYAFLTHRLGISELYTRLVELERTGGPRLLEFAAEGTAARRYRGPGGQTLMLRPDALVRLATGDVEVSHFVEVDRGTETSPATIAAKCQAYRRYELSGEEVRRHGVFPGVLFIVPDRPRARVIARVVNRLAPDARDLFAVAVDSEALAALSRGEAPTLADRAPPSPSSPLVGSPTAPH